MDSFRVKRSHAPLTDNEKWMVVNAHRYFSDPTSIDKQNKNIPLCKQVALVLGVAESTIGLVIADRNQHNDNAFTPHQNLGLSKSEPDENIALLLRTYITDNNKNGHQISTPFLRKFLSEHGYTLSK